MDTATRPKGHSKLGIAGCATAIAVWVYFAVAIVLVFFTDGFTKKLSDIFVPDSRGIADFSGLGVAIVLFTVIFFVIPAAGHVIGLVISLIGLLIPSNKRLFPVIGIFMNVLPVVILLVLYVIGSLAGPA